MNGRDRVTELFGYDISKSVFAVTHQAMLIVAGYEIRMPWIDGSPGECEPYAKMVRRIADGGDEIALAVKIADNLDNTRPSRIRAAIRAGADESKAASRTSKYLQSLSVLAAARAWSWQRKGSHGGV